MNANGKIARRKTILANLTNWNRVVHSISTVDKMRVRPKAAFYLSGFGDLSAFAAR